MKTNHYRIFLRFLVVFFTITCLHSTVAANIASSAEAPSIAGFYRMTMGDFEVISLSDGTNMRSVQQQLQLLQGDKTEIEASLKRSYPDGQINTAVNAFLINTGSKLVLVDVGNGKMGSPTMGKVVNNLRAAGYQPERIDEIYLTHMHSDHIGGLLSEEGRAFPNATVYANKTEAEYWLDENTLNAVPDAAKRTYLNAKAAITPYISAGKFKTFEGNTDLIPGIRAKSAFGHTPGHTMYFIESKGKTLVLWGDIIHVAAVQFANPAVSISFDSNPTEAVQSRQHILTETARNSYFVGGVHLLFPGIGHVRALDGNEYVFLPLDTSALK